MWSYRTRGHQTGSRLHIVRVDEFAGRATIYHIYVDGLHIRNPRIPSGVQKHLPHAPVSVETLRASVVKQGGYFTIPVEDRRVRGVCHERWLTQFCS